MSAPEKGDSGSALDEKHSADAVVAPGVGEHYDPDAIVPGSEGVTFHEMDTLRHVPDKINIASFLVIIVEFSERWSYYGTINVLNNVRSRSLVSPATC